jgi:hypothetical protein
MQCQDSSKIKSYKFMRSMPFLTWVLVQTKPSEGVQWIQSRNGGSVVLMDQMPKSKIQRGGSDGDSRN